MNPQELKKSICQRELEYGCYDPKIEGITIYTLIRREVRASVEREAGFQVMDVSMKVNKKAALRSSFISFLHLIRLFLSRKRYTTVFNAFPRVDRINGVYMDKFTDSVIEEGGIAGDYLILDHGRAGVHPKPRFHDDKIVYWDFLHVMARAYTVIFYKRFERKHQKVFDDVFMSIEKAFDLKFDRVTYVKMFYQNFLLINMLQVILRKKATKQVIGPARPLHLFIAAHRLGIKAIELQHGITYGETTLYSGYQDPLLVPDVFLAFGDNRPLNVYGIDESKIVNVGWALWDFLARLKKNSQSEKKDILVISEPEVTDAIINAVMILAESYPDNTFFVRPHPHEIITDQQKSIINSKKNVMLQDCHINITEAMMNFDYVIGENSTVIYEALSEKKKVGRLFFEGLHPKYLQPEDKECFWEIHNMDDFRTYLEDDLSARRSKSIYSKFNKEKFLSILE
jgi:hypothetical protein